MDEEASARRRATLLRWAAYVIIFFVAAFVLHFVVESIVTLVVGVVAPNTAKSVAGPFILVADFVLAGLVTWLIHHSGLSFTRSEEDQRRGEAFLAEEQRRIDEAEQHHADELRLQRLMGDVAKWRQARDLRAYASEALEALGEGDVTTSDGRSLRGELDWALDYADAIDPLHDRIESSSSR